MTKRLSPNDPNSFSRPEEFLVSKIHLDWTVDFETKTIKGLVQLQVKRIKSDVRELILDTRNLEIERVKDLGTGTRCSFEVGSNRRTFGRPLTIWLPHSKADKHEIEILYTTKNSTALQWLRPKQTGGKHLPFLFSQCEVKAPKDLVVLMSAVNKGNSVEGDFSVHKFTQKIPIPSYLIAIVVGVLERRKISDRIDVWSEPEIIEKAAYEFAEAETMLKTAEDIVGPYEWGRYDILVLPPSFPFGGMENPCLTFITPTVLAGDRSQVNVIAHEISHSWTGNLVTNKTFEDFWLNEGFTVFLERKIAGRMFGEKYRQFASIEGWKELKDTIKRLTDGGEAHFTKLIVNLDGIDPDDSFSTVPYEKGYAFLYHLEQVLGGPEVFEKFLRHYIENFKYQSLDTKTWKNYLIDYFKDTKSAALKTIDWDMWLYNTGLPTVEPKYDDTLAKVCRVLAERWLKAKNFDEFSSNDIKNMSPLQIQEFIILLLEEVKLPLEKIAALEKAYEFNAVTNSEIRFRWIRLCLQSHWKDIIPLAIAFVNEQGRMKYVRPIYSAMYSWTESRQIAIENFKKHRAEMMYMTSSSVAKDLRLVR